MKIKHSGSLLGAVTGLTMIAGSTASPASQIEGVNKELVCKRPHQNERQLKIHGCATRNYPEFPLAPVAPSPPSPPSPPYTS